MQQDSNNDKDLQKKVISFVSSFIGIRSESLHMESSLFHDLGVDGEDAVELLEAYSNKFNVDVREFPFLEYFGNEGVLSPFSLITKLVTGRLKDNKKTLTISDLIQAVKSGSLQK